MPSTKKSWRKQNGDKRFLKMLRRNPRIAIKATYLVEEDMELGSQPGSVEVVQVEFTDSPSARVRGWTLSLG